MGRARPAHGLRHMTRPRQNTTRKIHSPIARAAAVAILGFWIEHTVRLFFPTGYQVERSLHGLHAN